MKSAEPLGSFFSLCPCFFVSASVCPSQSVPISLPSCRAICREKEFPSLLLSSHTRSCVDISRSGVFFLSSHLATQQITNIRWCNLISSCVSCLKIFAWIFVLHLANKSITRDGSLHSAHPRDNLWQSIVVHFRLLFSCRVSTCFDSSIPLEATLNPCYSFVYHHTIK